MASLYVVQPGADPWGGSSRASLWTGASYNSTVLYGCPTTELACFSHLRRVVPEEDVAIVHSRQDPRLRRVQVHRLDAVRARRELSLREWAGCGRSERLTGGGAAV